MKGIKSGIIVVLLLVTSVLFVGCNFTNSSYTLGKVKNAYITLDINPSIEIITDEEGNVSEVNGLNDDAIKLLIDTNYTNESLDVVIESTLDLATEYGYLDPESENAILITTSTDTPEETEELEKKVSLKVSKFIEARKMHVEVLKASLEATANIKELAEQYNISVGKVKIITRALAMDKNLTFEVASEMSVRELNKVIKEGIKEVKEFYSEEVREEYKKAKELLEIEFELNVLGKYNELIQNAYDAVFEEILKDSDLTVQELKSLFLEYYNAMLAVEIPEVEEVEENSEKEEKDYNALKERREELKEILKELNKKIRGRNAKDLSKSEIEEIMLEIKNLLLEQKDIVVELNNGKFGQWMKDNHDDEDVEDYYEDVEDHYEDLFEEHNIDLDDLEDLFEDFLEVEIEALELEMELKLKDIREQFLIDSKAIREQIREENQILREIWKR